MTNANTGFQLLPWQEKYIEEYLATPRRSRRILFPHHRIPSKPGLAAAILLHDMRRAIRKGRRRNKWRRRPELGWGPKTSPFGENLVRAIVQGAD